MLMFINAKWVEPATLNAMMMYACFYGGFGQMVAGVFEVGSCFLDIVESLLSSDVAPSVYVLLAFHSYLQA